VHARQSSGPSAYNVLRPRPRAAVALGAAVLAATLLPLLAPQIVRRFVDDAIAGTGTRTLGLLAGAYLTVAVAGQGARVLTAWLAGQLAWDGTNRLRERAAAHALSLDLAYHGRHTPGEMIERVDGDVAAVADFIVAFLLDAVASLLLLTGVIVIVFTVDPRIGAVLLGYCLLIGAGMGYAQRFAVRPEVRSRAAGAAMVGSVEEWLAGAEDIRANGAGPHVVDRFRDVAQRWARAEFEGSRAGSAVLGATTVAFAAGTALILGLAAWSRQTGAISVGTAVLLFQYTLMVRTPFEQLIDQLRELQAAQAGFARIRSLLAERRTLPDPADPRPLPAAGPLRLELSGVGFGYADDDRPVLHDVSFTLAPGEKLGLVGRTGSGKTSIARLILRLYDPVSGSVRIGGVDLRDAEPASLRSRVCVVTQDVQLFAASVRDNLTLFRTGMPDARLRAALDEAGLSLRLDDGVDGLSAGEAQLLALARAFLTDPGLVVLDEAASRLDPATERRVARGVDRLLAGRTAVLIAHRLESLAGVDTIAVVSGGRIVEYGDRAALTAAEGSRFAAMLAPAGVRR
jgi:ATP-binding cassette subfamily B protein